MAIIWPIDEEGLFIGEDSYVATDGFAGIADRKIDPRTSSCTSRRRLRLRRRCGRRRPRGRHGAPTSLETATSPVTKRWVIVRRPTAAPHRLRDRHLGADTARGRLSVGGGAAYHLGHEIASGTAPAPTDVVTARGAPIRLATALRRPMGSHGLVGTDRPLVPPARPARTLPQVDAATPSAARSRRRLVEPFGDGKGRSDDLAGHTMLTAAGVTVRRVLEALPPAGPPPGRRPLHSPVRPRVHPANQRDRQLCHVARPPLPSS